MFTKSGKKKLKPEKKNFRGKLLYIEKESRFE